MTMQKSSTEKRYSTRPYYKFAMKQNWQMLVLFLILSLSIILIGTYISIDHLNDQLARYDSIAHHDRNSSTSFEEKVQSSLIELSVVTVVVSAGLAFISGITSLSYVNSKKNVGCYHSFPIRREHMFITETTIPMIYYLISITAAYWSSYFTFLVSFDGVAAITPFYIKVGVMAVLLYLFIYTTMLVSGGLTGTGPMKVIVAAVLFFLPVLLYLLVMALMDIDTSIDTSYYVSEEAISFVSPLVRVIIHISSLYGLGKFAWAFSLIMSAAMYVIALLLHKHRKSELSGTTVVWKPVFAAVKYSVIFTASHLGAYIFYYMGDESYVTLFFGAIFAGVVALMLMNCIMYRSTKAMFKNIKNFAIFMVATLAFITLVPLNATGLIGKNYPLSFTSSITLISDGAEIKFDDDEDIEKLYDIPSEDGLFEVRLRDFSYVYSEDHGEMEQLCGLFPDFTYKASYYYEKYGYYDEYGYYYEPEVTDKEILTEELILATKEAKGSRSWNSVSTAYVTYIQKPLFGIPLAKNLSIDTNSELWEYISSSEEFVAQYDISKVTKASGVNYMDFTLFGKSSHNNISKANSEAIEKLISACKLNPERDENSIYVGNITIGYNLTDRTSTSYYKTINFPVFTCDVEIINLLGELLMGNYGRTDGSAFAAAEAYMSFDTEEDVIGYILENLTAVALVDATTWEAKIIDKPDDIETLVTSGSTISDRYWNSRLFVKEFDADYIMLVNINGSQMSVRFRDGAIDNATLRTIFESYK